VLRELPAAAVGCNESAVDEARWNVFLAKPLAGLAGEFLKGLPLDGPEILT
jgi:hypothetical protein